MGYYHIIRSVVNYKIFKFYLWITNANIVAKILKDINAMRVGWKPKSTWRTTLAGVIAAYLNVRTVTRRKPNAAVNNLILHIIKNVLILY